MRVRFLFGQLLMAWFSWLAFAVRKAKSINPLAVAFFVLIPPDVKTVPAGVRASTTSLDLAFLGGRDFFQIDRNHLTFLSLLCTFDALVAALSIVSSDIT